MLAAVSGCVVIIKQDIISSLPGKSFSRQFTASEKRINPQTTSLTEQEIIKGCIKKKPASQRLLFDQYAGKMMALCLRYARDQQEAQDFLQLGFIKIFDYVHQYKGAGSFEGWMRRVFVSIATRELSKRKMHFDDISDIDTGIPFEAPGVVSKMSEEEIHQLIRKLPDGYRVVFNMHVIEGYSHDEIAAMLNIQPATSRTQLLKARKMLQGLITKRYNNITV
jgi:RNA polymerase sigma factor (sigma-70 family)